VDRATGLSTHAPVTGETMNHPSRMNSTRTVRTLGATQAASILAVAIAAFAIALIMSCSKKATGPTAPG